MDFTGLIHYFPVQRELTDQERQYHLEQSRRLEVQPRYQLCVIKMNSTYLESVDKWFAWKGLISALALTVLLLFSVPIGFMTGHSLLSAAGVLETDQSRATLFAFGGGLGALLGLIWWGMLKLLRKESFALTHYPLRFNRRNRTVYYFRPDGTIGTVPWDEVYFTLGYSAAQWEVRGHVLAADRRTVLDTFALSYSGVILKSDLEPGAAPSDNDYVRGHWEFVRRYMEEGPHEVSHLVDFCMPVDGRKETVKGGAQRIFANFSGGSALFTMLVTPLCGWYILGRMFAMRTCKVPQWPEQIEQACQIDANDIYAIAGDSAGDRVAG
ncbi:hypothetical protein KY495_09815 [Massilia sp. PAMC28688]|uniref:DUF6708 domain-containing protein n=1 Tax=Massilia sp. PAMC28688 TaxID=2861283 RepID=UPI001C626971|nr:DUF6708 domain-containing protein [Massilia sp. PAMC28688]QYF95415.1 hypothetical protein KY495_09815 [Massilia sp. PAMC28688]